MAPTRASEPQRAGRAVRYVRALLGVPDSSDTQAPSWVSGAMILALLVASWRFGVAIGGSNVAAPHWFYLPVGAAAARFRSPGAVAAGLAAGILAGPLLPASTAEGAAQPLSDWASRAGFFVGIGLFLAWLVALYRRATDQLRSTKAVATALMGSMGSDPLPTREARARIEAALRPGAIGLVLQPIVDLRDGHPVGYEALSRFALKPQRPPNEWFTEAWSVGLGIDLELAAFRAAIELLPRVPGGYLSVNISPATLMSPAFRDSISALPRDRLVVEMTEHVPVSDYDALRETLDELRDRGVRYAVDDAGAGYASLRHVIRLEPDIIKVDTGLVRGLDTNPLLRSVTTALIRFGQDIGAQTVAEGVESDAEAEALRALGARYAQGYLFSPPMPVVDLFEPVKVA